VREDKKKDIGIRNLSAYIFNISTGVKQIKRNKIEASLSPDTPRVGFTVFYSFVFFFFSESPCHNKATSALSAFINTENTTIQKNLASHNFTVRKPLLVRVAYAKQRRLKIHIRKNTAYFRTLREKQCF